MTARVVSALVVTTLALAVNDVALAQSQFDLSARLQAISGLTPEEIQGVFAAEQRADIVLVDFDIVIPVVVEPQYAYVLIQVAGTGEWVRHLIDLSEWRTDWRPALEARGVEIHKQPPGTIDTLSAGQEAAQIGAAASMSAAAVADAVFGPAPVNGVAPAPSAAANPGPLVSPSDINESDSLGMTEGRFRVDEKGAATYSIPIQSAAGTAGVVPKVSLNYSSASGNGIAGRGWSIGGLSGISRCRQTREQDRNTSALSFTSDDRFCLDGMRLLLVSGSTYGAPGSTYRTEIDGGDLVTAGPDAGGEPKYFSVSRKDGSVSHYGEAPGNSSQEAKLKNSSHTLTWGIRRYQDRIGNSIWFEYETGTSALRIQEIRYAYGLAAGPSGYNARISFQYSARTDPINGYIAGYLFQNDKRLINIRSYNSVDGNEQEIRNYVLRYGEEHPPSLNTVSRLTSVQECLGSVCLPKTEFDWVLPTATGGPSVSELGGFSLGSSYSSLTPLDINGDAKTDLVWLTGTGSSKTLRYALANGSGFESGTFSNGSSTLSLPIGQQGQPLSAVDYNLDGRQDVAWFDNNAKRWRIILAEPYGNAKWRLRSASVDTGIWRSYPSEPNATFSDVNADGAIDIVYGGESEVFEENEVQIPYTRLTAKLGLLLANDSEPDTSSTGFHIGRTITVQGFSTLDKVNQGYVDGRIISASPDVNGDGQVDLVVEANGFAYALALHSVSETSTAVAFDEYFRFPNLGSSSGPDMDRLRVLDINADGLSDFFYPLKNGLYGEPADTYHLQVNKGDGHFVRIVINDVAATYSASPSFADWNSDGYPDLLWKDDSAGEIRVRLWNSADQDLNSYVVVSSTPSTNNQETAVYFDWDGDGVTDILRINANGTQGLLKAESRRIGSVAADAGSNRIARITNGLGAETTVTYEPLSTTAHYERLEVRTSSQPGVVCVSDPELGQYCYDGAVYTSDATSFYEAINGPWDLPSSAQTLGKNSPVLETNGAYYVVTRVEASSPAAGAIPYSVNSAATSSVSHYYSEAKVQAAGRGFLGFERLTTVDDQTGIESTTRYRQDWPFLGKPISTIVRSGAGELLSTSTSEWEILEWGSGIGNDYRQGGSSAIGPVHVVEALNTSKSYDLQNAGLHLSTVETTSDYDGEGNVTDLTVRYRTPTGALQKSVHTHNDYDSTNFPLRLGHIERVTVTTNRPGQPSKPSLVTSFGYKTSGNQTGLLETETIQPGSANFELVYTHGYDSYGNLNKTAKSGGGETRCNNVSRIYDSTGRYLDEERDCLGRRIVEVLSRNKFGQPTETRTYVGSGSFITTEIDYGALGRPLHRYASSGEATTTYNDASVGNCPAGTVFKSVSVSASGGQSATCIDVLGRSVRELSIAFDGTWNAQDTEYDELGRRFRQSEPFNLVQQASAIQRHWTEFGYDDLGRVVATTFPDDSTASVEYDGLTTRMTNDVGVTKTEVRNVLGEITDVYNEFDGNVLAVRTQYGYDSDGNLRTVTDNAGNVITTEYDLFGRKDFIDFTNDPDNGFWDYEYNHFGELDHQTDAKGQVITFGYDGLGRMTSRTDHASQGGPALNQSTWQYDTASNGLGQLHYMEDSSSGYRRTFTYDGFGRPNEITTRIDGVDYTEKTTYDQYGRIFQQFDAAGDGTFSDSGTRTRYNPYGYAESIGDVVEIQSEPTTTYVKFNNVNARGQVTSEGRSIDAGASAAAVEVAHDFYPKTGRAKTILATSILSGDVQNLTYAWDTLGNLTSRIERSGSKNLTESFDYDDLNRLTDHGVSGSRVTTTYDVDNLGNIKTKSDVAGTYQYGQNGAGPHAVTSFAGNTYTYDSNGNNISGDGRTIEYTVFDKPSMIAKGGHTTTIEYGPDRSRYKRVDDDGTELTTTLYVGNVEIINLPNGDQQRKRYIAGVAVETRTTPAGSSSSTNVTDYLFHDHLGSLDVITDKDGQILEELSFDAWGKRRNATDWLSLSATELALYNSAVTTRGYTSHEMMDAVGVVHMNGRIYDAHMARFLQADPIVQDPSYSQSLNRYSYVWNNPLNATDPSGYWAEWLVWLGYSAFGSAQLYAIYALEQKFDARSFDQLNNPGDSLTDGLFGGTNTGVSSSAFSPANGNIDTYRTDELFYDQSLYVEPGPYSQSRNMAWAAANDPNARFRDRVVNSFLLVAVLPVSLVDDAVNAVRNVPYGASMAGQSVAAGRFAQTDAAAIIAYLNAIRHGAEAFVGAGAIVPATWARPGAAARVPQSSVTNSAGRQFWTRSTNFNGTRVFQRNDLIDPSRVDDLGRTNIQRMQEGLAPIGPDGRSLNLHHMTQTEAGSLAEVTATFHQQNSRVLHINPSSVGSGINRAEFDRFREAYWRSRAGDF